MGYDRLGGVFTLYLKQSIRRHWSRYTARIRAQNFHFKSFQSIKSELRHSFGNQLMTRAEYDYMDLSALPPSQS